VQSQRSLNDLKTVELTASPRPQPGKVWARGHFCDYLPTSAWTVLVEPDDLDEQGKHYLERVADSQGLFSVQGAFHQLLRFPSVRVSALPAASMEATCHLRVESVERFVTAERGARGADAQAGGSEFGTRLRAELESVAAGDRVLIACHNDAERNRLA